MNSGKFINDLGDYNNCLFNSDQFTYITMRMKNKFVGFQYVGLCAPNECTAEIVDDQSNFSDTIQTFLNNLYKEKTGDPNGAFSGILFYVPTETKPLMDWSNYTVIGLLSFIFFIGVVGSVLSQVTEGL
jgi:hypothetical protein